MRAIFLQPLEGFGLEHEGQLILAACGEQRPIGGEDEAIDVAPMLGELRNLDRLLGLRHARPASASPASHENATALPMETP